MDNRKIEYIMYEGEGDENLSQIYYPPEGEETDNKETTKKQLQRLCNDNATTLQRDCNDNATTLQTRNATLQRLFQQLRVSDKTKKNVKENAALCKLLMKRGFVKNATGGLFNLYNLNINVPDTLVEAVKKEGYFIKKRKLNELILCLRINRRFKISTVVMINVIWLSALIYAFYDKEVKASVKEPTKVEVLTAGITENDFDTAIREWEQATGKKIYPAGRECLKRAAKGMNKDQIVELINKNVR